MSDSRERGRLTGDESASLVHGRDAANVRSLLSQYDRAVASRQDTASSGGERPRMPGDTYVERPGQGESCLQSEPRGDGEREAAASSRRAPQGAVMVDYIRATLPAEAATFRELAEWLGASEARPGGWRGWYDKSASVGDGGLLAWCTDEAMAERNGILVDLPGRACGALGERLVPFLRWCVERGRVRRLDLAVDDTQGRLTYERLEAAVDAGALVTRAREAHWIRGHTLASGERTGWTLYVGSRRSQWMIRFYDKAAERLERAGLDVGGEWIRCELEAHGDYATRLAGEVLDDASVAVGQIARCIRLCEPSATDARRRRWPVASWWREFLGDVRPGASLVAGEDAEASIERWLEFMRRQIAPMMAAITEARGGDVSWMYELVDDGHKRLKPRHLAAIRAEQEREAVPV